MARHQFTIQKVFTSAIVTCRGTQRADSPIETAGAPPSYEVLRKRAVAIEVLGAHILIAHPEDLIRMKMAVSRFRDRPEAKRRQDLDDIAVLERLRAQQNASR